MVKLLSLYIQKYGIKFIPTKEWIEFFFNNSKIIKKSLKEKNYDEVLKITREKSWLLYQKIERKIYEKRIKDIEDIEDIDDMEKVFKLVESFKQTRKSRTGKQFEHIIYNIMKYEGLEFSFQCKGKIKGDFVFEVSKNKYVILSLKTTLKERWKQVIFENEKITESYLLCVDENLPQAKINEITKYGIKFVLPSYLSVNKKNVISLNEFIEKFTIKKKQKKIKILDLFCGCGGLSEGFRKAGFNIVIGIDNDKKSCDTYTLNGKKSLCQNIQEINEKKLKKEIGKIDIIIGGPPCQGFSMAGKRDKKDPRNSLFMDFAHMIGCFKPKVFVMENVIGILSMKNEKGEKIFDTIQKTFEDLGYLISYSKLIASDYEVPQKRKRIFIIGTKNKIIFEFPTPKSKEIPRVGDILEDKGKNPELIDKKYFCSTRLIDGFIRRKERNKKQGKGFGAQFLDFDRPSYTISSRYWKDGADALVVYNLQEKIIRKLTEKECARIQSFPDDYQFSGKSKDIYHQIGNAVPVKLAYHIANSIRKQFFD